MHNLLDNLAGWTFLNEPLGRWAIFVGALLAIMWGWNGVISFMK